MLWRDIMAGHSQFKNIMHRKNAQDLKKARIFTKMVHEITVAVQLGGVDPEMNTRLRAAILAAREVNMPKDRIENAIKKASGEGRAIHYQEMRYEGYGPGGVAVMVFALSDNANRTAGEVRAAFCKHGGTLGGSVSYLFQNIGLITYSKNIAIEEVMLESALSGGATDFAAYQDIYEIRCNPSMLHAMKDMLVQQYGKPLSAEITWVPLTTIQVDSEVAKKVMDLLAALEESEDVQYVVVNIDLPKTKEYE